MRGTIKLPWRTRKPRWTGRRRCDTNGPYGSGAGVAGGPERITLLEAVAVIESIVPARIALGQGRRSRRDGNSATLGADDSTRGPPMTTVREISSGYIDEVAEQDPVRAERWGVPSDPTRLADYSPAGYEALRELLQRTHDALADADPPSDEAERLGAGFLTDLRPREGGG